MDTISTITSTEGVAVSTATTIENIKDTVIKGGYDYYNEFVNAICVEGHCADAMEVAYNTMDIDTDYAYTLGVLEWIGTDMEFDWDDMGTLHNWVLIGAKKAMDDMEWDNLMEQGERLADIVGRYQAEFDGYVADLKKIADSEENLISRFDYLRAYWIMKKIEKLGEDMLFALEDETNCSMGAEDGYWFDTEELGHWFGYYGNYEPIYDFTDLIENLEYQAFYEDRIVPLTDSEAEDIMDCHLDETDIDGNNWGFGLGYALALYECSDMEDAFKWWYDKYVAV